MKKTLLTTALIALTSQAQAVSFDFDTSLWFKKIHLECRDTTNMCGVWVDGKYKGENPYTVIDNTAETFYNNYVIRLDLNTGNYKWEKIKGVIK